MKILIINNYYYPNMMGGAEHSIKLLAEHLVMNGNIVFVLSMDGDANIDVTKAENINGVFVHRSYSKTIYRRRILKNKGHIADKFLNGWHSIYNIKMNLDVKKVVNIVHPDIIHTQNLVSMSYWVWKYAYKKHIPIIHTLRDYWLLDPTTNLGQSPALLTIPFRKYHRNLSNKCITVVTSPSKRNLELFQKEGYFANSKAVVVVNAINLDEKLLKECIDEKKNRTSNTINFLFVGHVTEIKGIRLLIDTFINCDANATLTICGDGDLLQWIKDKKDTRIICRGKLKPNVLALEYRKADVLVVPSLWEEPFGRIVIEGAQYALPIIGSNRGGIPEIIKELNYGDVFEPNNIKEFEELIYKYSSRKFLKTINSNGPQHLYLYSISQQIRHFMQLYYLMIRKRDK